MNELTGSDSVHTAHGIMLQELLQELLPLPGENIGGYQPDLTSMEKTGERSATFRFQDSLPECYVSKRKSLQFHPGGELGIPTDRDQWSWVFLNNPKRYFATERKP